MKAKEFIPASKPRNFVAKNQKTAGAGAHKDLKRAKKQGDVKHKKDRIPMDERVRDPEDWDEGNTEPGNNFAIYINGKKWKVFPGPYGAYADSPEEEREFYRLKDMARRKSQQTGKKWEVYKTGEQATESMEEGWKEKLAAAALAGSMALGAGGAKADGPTPEPIAATAKADSLASRYTAGVKWPAAYTIEYKGETYTFAGRTEAAPRGGEEVKVPAALIGIRGLGASTVTLGKDGKYYAGTAD